MPERIIQTDGAVLRVADSGTGEPSLVFLHYWGGSARTWQSVINGLAPHRRCVAINQRGWGGSVATDGRYDLHTMADDVEAWRGGRKTGLDGAQYDRGY
jgi:pimeloyl-ACP methyl ester carboxylesterase